MKRVSFKYSIKRQKQNAFFVCLFVLAIISYFSLLLFMFYSPFSSKQKEFVPRTSSFQQTNIYLRNWNISTSAQETFYASSDHSAFGEGFRYSVLSGPIALSNLTRDNRGNHITKTTGHGADVNIVWFLSDIWEALEVPEERRCPIAQCDWTLFRTSDESKLLIAISKDNNATYIAEQIL